MKKKLSLMEKIGQRFIMGVNNTNTNEVIKLIKNTYIGGVVLYKKNYQSYDEMISLINRLKDANKDNKVPLFIAIDEEGGKVNRLPDEIHNLKNIYDVSKKDVNLVIDYANIIGKVLKESGINMNLAPVLDIYNGTTTRTLYKRCFYGDEEMVIKGANNYLNGLDNLVIPVIKHYPGHGLTKKDTHFSLPYITDLKELERHLKPFNTFKDKADAIMVGHLIIHKLTNLLPASISTNFLSNYLRKDYNGLIMTDEINMLKKQPMYHFSYMNKALRADSDIILLKVNNAMDGYKVIGKYKKILMGDKKYQELLDKSVDRIINIKEKYHISDTAVKGIDVATINQEIDELNKKITD